MKLPDQNGASDEAPLTVTVVVPILNEAAQIATLVRALARLDVPVVFVDGGSHDGSWEQLQGFCDEHPKHQLIRSAPGRGVQLQAGFERTQTDVVLFLHADCRLPMDFKDQIQEALSCPGVVGGAFCTRHVGRHRSRLWLMVSDMRSGSRRDAFGDQGIFARVQVLRARGGVPKLPLFEDVELSRRLQPSVRCPGPILVSARRHARGPLWSLALVNTLPLFYDLGVSPKTLANWYQPEATNSKA